MTQRLYVDSDCALRTDDEVELPSSLSSVSTWSESLRFTQWPLLLQLLPLAGECSHELPHPSALPCLASSSVAASSCASRHSVIQGSSAPVSQQRKLWNRLINVVSGCGADTDRTYHLTKRLGGPWGPLYSQRRCAAGPNTSLGKPAHSSRLSASPAPRCR